MNASKNSSPSDSKPVDTLPMIGTLTLVPGPGEGSHQTKSQISYRDKQSGSYGRATAVEKASTGEFQWKNGTSGTKSEYKQSKTIRFGDQSGYTEVYNEQRVRDVTYHNNAGSKNRLTNDGVYNDYRYDSHTDTNTKCQCVPTYKYEYQYQYQYESDSDYDSDY